LDLDFVLYTIEHPEIIIALFSTQLRSAVLKSFSRRTLSSPTGRFFHFNSEQGWCHAGPAVSEQK
jgi:hypothetical protein